MGYRLIANSQKPITIRMAINFVDAWLRSRCHCKQASITLACTSIPNSKSHQLHKRSSQSANSTQAMI